MIKKIASDFFKACETGKGWEVCKVYCHPNATFNCQSKLIGNIKTLENYTNWMNGAVNQVFPGCSYDIKSFTVDENTAVIYGIFNASHTGQGGPVPPTGKKISCDYVYVMSFKDGLICDMTKIWNSELTAETLGWKI